MSCRPVVKPEVRHDASLADPARHISSPRPRRKLIALILLVLASVEFVVRGPLRFAREGFDWNDFLAPFVQAKLWLRGSDPYDPAELVQAWPADSVHFGFLKKDLADGVLVAKRGVPSPYPPTAFLLLAPMSGLSWREAHSCWLLLLLLSLAVIVWTIASLSGVSWRDPKTLIFLAAIFALAPFHTAVATGNIVLPAFACAMAGVWAAARNRAPLAGLLIAISVCLKPPVGLVFLASYLLRRDWRIVLMSAVAGFVMLAAAIGRLLLAGTNWLTNYRADVAGLFATGAINDFTTANPLRFHLLNLQMPLYWLFGSAPAANGLAWALGAVLLLLWIRSAIRHQRADSFLQLSTLMMIAMLPIYHRFVDAVVIALPVAWALLEHRGSLKLIRCLALLSIAPFLVPGAAMLSAATSQPMFPLHVVNSWWWQAILLPHQVWAVLSLALALLAGMVSEWPSKADTGSSRPTKPSAEADVPARAV